MAHGKEAVTSRQLMNRFLAALFAQGWVLNLSTDASKSVSDADTLLFRFQNPVPAPCEWMAISFSNSDNIRFMRDVQQHDGVVDAFINLLADKVQRHNPHEKVPGCYEIKLRGNPWRASGGETMYARLLLLQLLQTLEQHGWTVYASVDQKYQSGGSNNSSASGDTDTWHCCRQTEWKPGMPVYHN